MRIAFEELRVDRGAHRALDGVSGEIEAGQVTAVIGPSGAGKSTLLAVLAGLERPDAGRVRFDGDDVTAWPPERRRLGVVFQELRLFDFLSGRDNAAFAPRVEGVAPDEQRRRVDEALALARADKFAHRPARVLSGGERQRIALARALAMRPRALLLDEPFAALDAELRRGLRDELRALIRRLGCTTLLITHDRDDAFALASRFVVLHDGRVEQAGDAAELYSRPASEFVATLLGEAALLPVGAREGNRGRVLGEVVELTGDGARAVVRPEAVELAPTGEAASLIDARFAGARWRLTLELAGGTRLTALADRAPESPALCVRARGPLHTIR
jgi:putative spermidine/putrescine transport system ATP-binding protein